MSEQEKTTRPGWRMIGLRVPKDIDGGAILKVYRCPVCDIKIETRATEMPPRHTCTEGER